MKLYLVWMYGNLESIHRTKKEAKRASAAAAKADWPGEEDGGFPLKEFEEETCEIVEYELGKPYEY